MESSPGVDVLSRCDDDGSLRKLIEFVRVDAEFLSGKRIGNKRNLGVISII